MEHTTHLQEQYSKAAGLLKVNGILSIVFGSIGTFIGLIFTALMLVPENLENTEYEAVGAALMAVIVFIFWVVPHVYLIVSGSLLIKSPKPSVALGLVITNLIIGLGWNIVLLVFAIINLTQIAEYKYGYQHRKK